MYESRAIGRHLIELFDKDHKLKPSDLKEYAMYELYLSVEVEEFNVPASTIVFETIFKKMFGWGEPDAALLETESKKLIVSLDVLEKRLATTKNKFLVSNQMTFADLVYIPYAEMLLGSPYAAEITSRPHVSAWLDRLRNLPEWQKLSQM